MFPSFSTTPESGAAVALSVRSRFESGRLVVVETRDPWGLALAAILGPVLAFETLVAVWGIGNLFAGTRENFPLAHAAAVWPFAAAGFGLATRRVVTLVSRESVVREVRRAFVRTSRRDEALSEFEGVGVRIREGRRHVYGPAPFADGRFVEYAVELRHPDPARSILLSRTTRRRESEATEAETREKARRLAATIGANLVADGPDA